ncbi:BlaI/MecI/CopY family transcriptional regulator [Streptomyces yerevanensis]|uniref:BlaI/MecI/CopY family transcriptional regulator n=1 Tax=Streptomyces yerevanensis TaxID=66378 RepID=UPI0005274E35|nr:BlaI/MecI/CopY family transcriptional regulator [Streptomyces yerevanensis]
MSEVESATTELKTQYAAQVAADLERNAKDQERIGAEVTELQEQLLALQRDHALLVNLQQALSGESPADANPGSDETVTAAPSVPRQASAEPTPARQKKAAAPKPGKTPAKSPGTKAPTTGAKQPTLGELIRTHLGRQSEPSSSAEISSALAQAHPDRDIKPKVVRTTVEGLVAKGHVHRTKQGKSVYYTASGTAPADTSPEQKDLVTA